MSSLKKIPSPLVSLLPIVLLVGMLFATIHTFGSDALEGGSQISTVSPGKITNSLLQIIFQELLQQLLSC